MVQNIDGKKIAERIKDEVALSIHKINGPRPNLAIILVGEREDSKIYVNLKQKEGKRIGVDTHLYHLDADVSEKELFDVINFLNKDILIDGILIQLPLPPKFNADKIIAALDPFKDVDGFHPNHPNYLVSPVLASVSACLEEIKMSGDKKTACILYNSDIFGRGLEDVAKKQGFIICEKDKIGEADLIVTALGEPNKIKKEMVKEGVVVIDIGISKVGDKVYGDADYEDLKNKASYITPVPGGIGPMTIAFLFQNVLEIFLRRLEFEK